mmetsp:Transcript_91988/g.269073  ORF Transcript_91988/g.269073 Transcript_91988/m.269073 type:complete len:204 (+) Transcript_91988:1230-1841(+)
MLLLSASFQARLQLVTLLLGTLPVIIDCLPLDVQLQQLGLELRQLSGKVFVVKLDFAVLKLDLRTLRSLRRRPRRRQRLGGGLAHPEAAAQRPLRLHEREALPAQGLLPVQALVVLDPRRELVLLLHGPEAAAARRLAVAAQLALHGRQLHPAVLEAGRHFVHEGRVHPRRPVHALQRPKGRAGVHVRRPFRRVQRSFRVAGR